MEDVAGWVLLGIVVLVFAYILPAVIRSRQVVVDSRVDDRYSDDLRVVATAGHRPLTVTTSTSSIAVHRSSQEATMSTPADRQLAAADARRLAAARAARAAASSSRAAAARRRLAITLLLLVAAAGTWAGFAALSWPVAPAVIASLALAGVIVLGRRAAAAGAAADARWAEEMTSIRSHARVRAESTVGATGRPRLRVDVDPASLIAEAEQPPVVAPRAGERESAAVGGWTPVPVPPPAYTLKQAAPRRAVSPLVMDAATEQMDAVETPEVQPAEPVVEAAPAASDVEPAMDLQAILARRRAVG